VNPDGGDFPLVGCSPTTGWWGRRVHWAENLGGANRDHGPGSLYEFHTRGFVLAGRRNPRASAPRMIAAADKGQRARARDLGAAGTPNHFCQGELTRRKADGDARAQGMGIGTPGIPCGWKGQSVLAGAGGSAGQ